MADYNLAAKSLYYGLSDFWLQFFKETSTLETFYAGAEIQIGQAYLDLLSLLLNNSIQDTTIFNKEYFKLLTIKENEIQFIPGVTPAANRFRYILPDNIVFVPHLNNKILAPTEALDRGVDYFISDNGTANQLDFIVDPTNAYYELTVGSSIASLKIRSKLPGAEGGLITIFLNDNGSTVITITRVDYAIVINYDGYFSTATHSAAAVVQAINTSPLINTIVVAEVVNSTVNGSPIGTAFPTPLQVQDTNPLTGFAQRKIINQFGGSFMSSLIPSWTRAGVRKGDTLRLRSGRGIGVPKELDIDLLQGNKIYVNENTPIPEDSEIKVDFVVLRTPANNLSENEAIASTGNVIQFGADASIVAATRTLSSPTAAFAAYHVGDLIRITSGVNAGNYYITQVSSSTSVVIGATNLITDPPPPPPILPGTTSWELISVINPAFTGALITSVVSTGPDTALLTTDFAGAFPPLPVRIEGGVLRVKQGGVINRYNIIARGTTGLFATLTVKGVIDLITPATDWAVANVFAPVSQVILSPPVAWPKEGSQHIRAYREVDSQLVVENIDYRFNVETGLIAALSVWKPSFANTVTYRYALAIVQTVVPTQLGVLGSITAGTPSIFTAPDANFLPEHVCFGLKISNSSFIGPVGSTNNGIFHIQKVLSTTSVELVSDKLAVAGDTNNGSLVWSMHMRGSSVTESDSAIVNELAFWAPDISVDRLHLYNTYGYLINKFKRSSEAYRTFIRGIFQLFMLGPTLERFESAINIVAGLPVIRDDGEVLQSYSSGAIFTAADGNLAGLDSSFNSLSYVFTTADLQRNIYVATGLNANRTYTIISIVNPNKVILNITPTTDGPITWEVRETFAVQTLVTSRNTYTFERNIVLKSKYTDPGNIGILTLNSFAVISNIFTVTDYIETPRWWVDVVIPAELWGDASITRRTSTAQLFENSVNPGDEGKIGDPGFIIGADDEGFVPPTVLLAGRLGVANGTLLGDVTYPVANNTFFECATGNFTAADTGNLLQLVSALPPTIPVSSYRIIGVVSATRIQLESFVQLPATTTTLSWEIHTGTLPLRHKAAFVILDKYLKHHLFTVQFDFSVISLIDLEFFIDLQDLIFQAKPSYTYLIVNPYALFNELLKIEEEFVLEPRICLAGSGGEIIAANESPLLIIGSSWPIGQWFRYVEAQGTTAVPAAAISNALGVPDGGFQHHLSKFSIVKGAVYPDNITTDHTAFTSGGIPIQHATRLPLLESGPVAGVNITVGTSIKITFPTPVFTESHVLNIIRITGSGLGNDGDYIIGDFDSSTEVNVYRAAPTVSEVNVTGALYIVGDQQGCLKNSTGGVAIFKSFQSVALMSTPSLAGYHIRRPVVGSDLLSNPVNVEAYRLHSLEYVAAEGANVWLLYNKNRVEPLITEPNAVGDVVGGNQLTLVSGSVLFTESMGKSNRLTLNSSTYLKERYYIEFVGGANNGLVAEITTTLNTTTVLLDLLVGLTPDATAQFFIYHLASYEVVTETSIWELIKPQILLTENTVDLTNTPAQDVNVIVYRTYGVREPIDPTLSVFDDSVGDTLYSIGMPDPRPPQGKSRTSLDTDLREDPIQVSRI